MKCDNCKSEMREGFTTILVTDNQAEECTQYKCDECGAETWHSKSLGKNYTI